LPRFLTPVAFDAPWLRNGATYQESKTSNWSVDDRSSFSLRHLAHSPQFLFTGGGVKKFEIRLEFGI